MAESIINISTEQVQAQAQKIGQINTQLEQKLLEIKTTIDSLSSTWQSQAGDSIRAKIDGMAPRFTEYREVIQKYVDFLNSTAEAWAQTDQQVNQQASSFS